MMRRPERPPAPLRRREAKQLAERNAAEVSASSSVIGGNRPGRRAASIDLPAPGGPIINR